LRLCQRSPFSPSAARHLFQPYTSKQFGP